MTRKKSTRATLGISLVATVLLLGSTGLQAQSANLAARVNGEGITFERLQASVDSQIRLGYGNMTQPKSYKRVQRNVLDELIAQELLWQEAKRKGFVATPADVDTILEQQRQGFESDFAYEMELERNGFTPETYREDLKRQISVRRWAQVTFADAVNVSDQEIHEFYVANRERFTRPEEIRARHVLIKVEKDAEEAAVAEAQAKIEQILSEAKAGADFAELATKYSEGPSAPRGGDLGYFSRGRMVKPFEDAAFALKPGEISDVVRTRFGFHIIKLEARHEQGIVPEGEVAPQVRQHLASGRFEEAIGAHLEALKKEASIEILIDE